MPRIAKVVVELALDREFDYEIPASLETQVFPGSRVVVPFGRGDTRGYVLDVVGESEWASLKPIKQVLGEKPYITEQLLRLAKWISEYYCSPVEHAVRAVLPGAVRKRSAGFKSAKFVTLCVDAVEAVDVEQLSKRSPRQYDIVRLLQAQGGMTQADLLRAVDTTASTVKALEKKGLVHVSDQRLSRSPDADLNYLKTEPLPLMDEQADALNQVEASIQHETPGVVLLYGVTGSGKTEVYLQAIEKVLDAGGGAIVLVPEIALTPQTIERFKGRFGDCVAVLHSHLSDGERHDEWHRIHDGTVQIVVGARSAVFAPVQRLGLIVVDEEHEPSYKQEESPRYNARDVAVMRGRMEGCSVLLGSATPSLESYLNAKTGKYQMATMRNRVDNRTMPSMRIIDMRIEAERAGRVAIFSQELVEAIRKRLERSEQVMLFLNRRGYSTSLMCEQCGYVAQCSQCSVSYTYHRNDERLKCHICGVEKSPPEQCPECNDPGIKYSGIGAQRVETVVNKLFPGARVRRMDADVTRRKEAYHEILGDFRGGKIDILLGTQMIAKGLHFPNVTLIGVVMADLSLHMADFRAGERTFQLLTQVAGRAGRGDIPGEVIVQTFTPFHVAIQAARRLDFEGFCDQEAEFRRELSYPPYAHLICMTFRGVKEELVAFVAESFLKKLRADLPEEIAISGPGPAPLARAKGYFRYQILRADLPVIS